MNINPFVRMRGLAVSACFAAVCSAAALEAAPVYVSQDRSATAALYETFGGLATHSDSVSALDFSPFQGVAEVVNPQLNQSAKSDLKSQLQSNTILIQGIASAYPQGAFSTVINPGSSLPAGHAQTSNVIEFTLDAIHSFTFQFQAATGQQPGTYYRRLNSVISLTGTSGFSLFESFIDKTIYSTTGTLQPGTYTFDLFTNLSVIGGGASGQFISKLSLTQTGPKIGPPVSTQIPLPPAAWSILAMFGVAAGREAIRRIRFQKA